MPLGWNADVIDAGLSGVALMRSISCVTCRSNVSAGPRRSGRNVADASEIDTAFASTIEQQIGAIFVLPDPVFVNRRDELVTLAARHAVPTMYFGREFVATGLAKDDVLKFDVLYPALWMCRAF